jgi:tetratricopeptide (TPR) repeat protein
VTTTPQPQMAQYRLAVHYLNKLRDAADAVRHRRANLAYGLRLFDQEWEQIKYWQSWSAQHYSDDEACAQLCLDFSLVGLPVLKLRSNQTEHAVWLEAALRAAQQLHDNGAERTICHELSMTYYRLGALDKIEYFARQLLKLGEAADDLLSIERGFCGLGLHAEERGLYTAAEQYYQRALQMSIKLGIDTEIGRALNGLGSTAFCVGDYRSAHHYYTRHLELTERTGTKGEFCTALLSVGEALTKLRDYDRAEKYILRAIGICRAMGFQRLLGVGLLNLGSWAVEQNQLDTARNYFEQGTLAVRASATQRQIINGLSMLGYVWLRLGNLGAALAHLQEGLQIASAPHHICDLQRTLVYAYLALADLESAQQALKEALSIAQGLESYAQKAATLSCAVVYCQCRGGYELAAEWAGLLTTYAQHVDPNLLTASVYDQLKLELGAERYKAALERGKTLLLDRAVADATGMLA